MSEFGLFGAFNEEPSLELKIFDAIASTEEFESALSYYKMNLADGTSAEEALQITISTYSADLGPAKDQS